MDIKNIQHIIFDLDNTLWDFSGNSKKILSEIYEQFNLYEKGITAFDAFHSQYKFRNEHLWKQYAFGNVTRDEVRLNRFHITLNDFGIDNYVLANDFADFYIHNTRRQTDLLPGTIELLNYLKGKYALHIITNGFEEVQFFKLKNSGLINYFKTVTTAEAANALKPDKKIFTHALKQINSVAEHCIYIGDTPEVDGQGALNAGMFFILFNNGEKENPDNYYSVNKLSELMEIL